MELIKKLGKVQRVVFLAGVARLAVWMLLHFRVLVGTQNGFIRFFLTLVLAGAILLRKKRPRAYGDGGPAGIVARKPLCPPSAVPVVALFGAAGAIAGLVFGIRQMEWLGLLCLLFACLQWSLPGQYSRDGLLALLLLYWAHPLPGFVFGTFQLAMQRWSVGITEWFLHLCNVRVWADGFVLHTGLATYEVPQWCSGMRTATTVFLLALGLGILRRMRWYVCLAFVLLALAQALMLNVFRIAALVAYGAYSDPTASFSYLHNTAGIIVFGGIVLVYGELALWRWYRQRRVQRRRDLNPERMDVLREYPPFWRLLVHVRFYIFFALLAIAFVSALVYRSRSYHRAEMIKEVAVGLREAGRLGKAEQAASLVSGLVPDDTEWALLLVRLMLIRHKYQEVLAAVDRIPDEGENTATEKNILRSYSLMSLDRMAEAAELVGKLPLQARADDPRVAMILAEMGLFAGDPDEVARQARKAARWVPNLHRIRGLYPFLRRHRRWRAIVDTDTAAPYHDPAVAMAAAEAYMNLDLAPAAGRLALQAIKAWPEDPRVLEPLFFMSLKRGHAKWEPLFAEHLKRCVAAIDDPDQVYGLVDKCFQLTRPDLAWVVYCRIEELDPDHPAMKMILARFGHRWFAFRKRSLGISAPLASDKIDLKAFYLCGTMCPFWRDFCAQVPMARELAVADTVAPRRRFLEQAVAVFEERRREDRLSKDMLYAYVDALEMQGDVSGARRELEGIVERFPGDALTARVVLSGIYERRGKWQSVYETLRDYLEVSHPHLKPCLRLAQAQLNLRLSLAALHTAETTYRLFPASQRAAALLGTAFIRHGRAEEAHEVLRWPRPRNQRDLDVLETEALYKTERFAEAQALARSALLPRIPMPANATQRMFLPPAEASALWHRISIPSEKAFARNAETLEKNLEDAESPYLKAMLELWIEAYRNPDDESTRLRERWLACGRDRIEKATALNQLVLLLCLQERFVEARDAAGEAVKLFPESPTLWIILISLSGGDPGVIDAARTSCPYDSDIWLAELVTRTQRDDSVQERAWLQENMDTAVREQAYTPAAMARAAEYLFRGTMREQAATAARDAVARARGLLPAYVIGVKCALADSRWDRALDCTKLAIESSLQPNTVFYRKLVGLKSMTEMIDTDREMVAALRSLREREPDDALWAQMLGYVRFQRGGWEIIDALYQMTAALEGGATNKTPYIIAAESARRLGDNDRAIDLLRKGLTQHPDSVAMLNNLVYSLAYSPDGVDEALARLPELAERGGDDPLYVDTAAVVRLRAGQLDEAADLLTRLVAGAERGSREWFRAKRHLAEIAFRKGRVETAADILADTLKHTRKVPGEELLDANRLLSRIEEQREADERERRIPYRPALEP